MLEAKTQITAVSAVSSLANCVVNLYIDSGEEIDGRWNSTLELIDEGISATIQKAKASEIRRFERGGERLEGAARLYLTKAPSQQPDIVAIGTDYYKVFDVDFRPSRSYFKLIVARNL